MAMFQPIILILLILLTSLTYYWARVLISLTRALIRGY
jgi:hypothetical protein